MYVLEPVWLSVSQCEIKRTDNPSRLDPGSRPMTAKIDSSPKQGDVSVGNGWMDGRVHGYRVQ